MGPSELLALSLGLSVAVAAAALVGGRIVEALSADPRLRDRMWAAALVLPVLPPLAVGLILLTPPPVREIPAAPTMAIPVGGNLVFEVAPAAPGAAWTVEPGLAFMAVLGLAILLTLARSATLALRAARLRRLIREARDPDPATFGMVLAAARALSVPAPPIGVSDTASEPLLAGLRRPRLILPHGLLAAADPAVVRAMIAHELVHLKRGDHRALWLEEVLLALLAINPLMSVLRARRAAAREEVCDALALADAAAATRRAYAESLIGALRSRAGPQPLPALTFTGAGRRTAMRRLKAVLNPVVPAGRAVRMAALVLGLGLATVTVGVSVATAGQREDAVRLIGPGSSSGTDFATRLSTASAADYQLFCAADEGSMDRIACSMLLWDEALAEQSASSPAFCAPTQSDAGLEIIADGGRAAVLTAMPGSGSAKDAARRAMIVAFPCRGEPRAIPAEAVARAAASLGTEWEQRHGVLSREESAARRAAYDAATGADYQRMCASRDPGEDGFCAGVLFRANLAEAKAAAPTFCAPSFEGPEATSRFVATAKAGVAQVRVTANQSPLDVARSGLVRAYPCASGRTEAGPDVVVQMPVELVMGGASIGPGDEVRVALSDRDGILAQTLARGSDHGPTRAVSIPLTTDQFPGLGEGNRSYTLTGEVRDAQGVIRQIASPVVIRLGPGSQVSARNLSSTLDFGPV